MTSSLLSCWRDLPGVMSLAPLEDLSYVEVRPAENPEGVAALALGTDSKEAVDKRMEAMAPGDERSVALSNCF